MCLNHGGENDNEQIFNLKKLFYRGEWQRVLYMFQNIETKNPL